MECNDDLNNNGIKDDNLIHIHLGRKPKKRVFDILNRHRVLATERYNKKMSFSKIIIIFTALLFVLVLLKILFFIDVQNLMDTTIYATCLTVTGAIFGSSLVWYSKKAASENAYKLRISSYEDAIRHRLYFNESMMKLIKKYKISDEDLEYINNEGEIDEMMGSAIDSVVNNIDNYTDVASSENELQQFNL